MVQEFTLPDLGEGIHEAEIREVLVAAGDRVQEDEAILTVETDKATTEVPSPFTGTVQEIHVEQGELVNVGDLLLTFENGSEEGEGETSPADAAEETGVEKQEQEHGKGEGETESVDSNKKKAAAPEQPEANGRSRPVPASPATRRLARELEVDLRQVEGSGPGGRVTHDDVQAFAEGGAAGQKEQRKEEQEISGEGAKRPFESTPDLPDFGQWGDIERRPLRSVRRATARRMSQSWQQIPHVTHHEEVDVTALDKLRREYEQTEGVGLTLTPFVMKAAVAALKEYPRFNASLDMEREEIVLKHYYHLGVAVDTERGLIVPVIRDVDRKSIVTLAAELEETAAQTRAGEIGRERLQGGTFTITNVGPLGGTSFTPLINYPQAAILGMAQAEWRPVVHQPEGTFDPQQMVIEPRYRLPLMLGFDHRLSDGADAARFCNLLLKLLEEPKQLILNL